MLSNLGKVVSVLRGLKPVQLPVTSTIIPKLAVKKCDCLPINLHSFVRLCRYALVIHP